ncbi:sensor histidine kinase [Streptomyces scopuliridis]|uniref:sensor histidine kinase n=1 Tax=Streptomyces scopuliridis TaxID=452529 RepID=UPI00369C7B50
MSEQEVLCAPSRIGRPVRRASLSRGVLAARLAMMVTAATLVYFCLTVMLYGGSSVSGHLHLLLRLLPLLSILVLSLSRTRTWRGAALAVGWALPLQALVAYLPFLLLGRHWLGVPGCLAGSVLLALSGPLSWGAYSLVPASMVFICRALGYGTLETVCLTLNTAVTGLIVYGLVRLTEMLVSVCSAQDELTGAAVAAERSRFARDLHDLLGHGLSAITLRGELVYRMVEEQPDRVRQEITEILKIARRTSEDVRRVAHDLQDRCLSDEAASIKALLDAVGIRTLLELTDEPLPRHVHNALTAVLREGSANVLRHSQVRNCVIRIWTEEGAAKLSIVNDGVAARGPAFVPGGAGLGNLAARLSAIGGTFEAGVRGDGRFGLSATLSLSPAGTVR